jgi:hypothetical protein
MKSFLKFLTYLLLIAAFGYAIYNNQHQLTNIAGILQEGVWYLVLTTILLLGLVIYNQAALYTSIYEVFELSTERRHLLNLYLVARFIIVAAPSGGMSGWVPFIQDARVRRLPLGPVLVANLIYYILWYSNFAFFLLIGLLLLLLAHDLEWFEVAAATVLLLTDLAMIIGLILVGVAPSFLQRILDRLQQILARVSGWVKRPPPINPHQIHRLVHDLHTAVNQMRRVGTKTLFRPVQYALSNELLNLLILYLLGRAFSLNLTMMCSSLVTVSASYFTSCRPHRGV